MKKKLRVIIPKSTRANDQQGIIKKLMNTLERIDDELESHFKKDHDEKLGDKILDKKATRNLLLKHHKNENIESINQSRE